MKRTQTLNPSRQPDTGAKSKTSNQKSQDKKSCPGNSDQKPKDSITSSKSCPPKKQSPTLYLPPFVGARYMGTLNAVDGRNPFFYKNTSSSCRTKVNQSLRSTSQPTSSLSSNRTKTKLSSNSKESSSPTKSKDQSDSSVQQTKPKPTKGRVPQTTTEKSEIRPRQRPDNVKLNVNDSQKKAPFTSSKNAIDKRPPWNQSRSTNVTNGKESKAPVTSAKSGYVYPTIKRTDTFDIPESPSRCRPPFKRQYSISNCTPPKDKPRPRSAKEVNVRKDLNTDTQSQSKTPRSPYAATPASRPKPASLPKPKLEPKKSPIPTRVKRPKTDSKTNTGSKSNSPTMQEPSSASISTETSRADDLQRNKDPTVDTPEIQLPSLSLVTEQPLSDNNISPPIQKHSLEALNDLQSETPTEQESSEMSTNDESSGKNQYLTDDGSKSLHLENNIDLVPLSLSMKSSDSENICLTSQSESSESHASELISPGSEISSKTFTQIQSDDFTQDSLEISNSSDTVTSYEDLESLQNSPVEYKESKEEDFETLAPRLVADPVEIEDFMPIHEKIIPQSPNPVVTEAEEFTFPNEDSQKNESKPVGYIIAHSEIKMFFLDCVTSEKLPNEIGNNTLIQSTDELEKIFSKDKGSELKDQINLSDTFDETSGIESNSVEVELESSMNNGIEPLDAEVENLEHSETLADDEEKPEIDHGVIEDPLATTDTTDYSISPVDAEGVAMTVGTCSAQDSEESGKVSNKDEEIESKRHITLLNAFKRLPSFDIDSNGMEADSLKLTCTMTNVTEPSEAAIEDSEYDENLADGEAITKSDGVISEDSLAPKVTADYSLEPANKEEPVELVEAPLEQFEEEGPVTIEEASSETSPETVQILEQTHEESEEVLNIAEKMTEPISSVSSGESFDPKNEEKELNYTRTNNIEPQDVVVEDLGHDETLANDAEKSQVHDVIIEDSLAPNVTADYSLEPVKAEEPVILVDAPLEGFEEKEAVMIGEASLETSPDVAPSVEQTDEESEQPTEPVYTESRDRSVEPNYEEKELNYAMTDSVEPLDAVVEDLEHDETLENDAVNSQMDEVIIEDSLAPQVTADHSIETPDATEPVVLMGASLEQFDAEEPAMIGETSLETSLELAPSVEQTDEESEQPTEPVYTESRDRSVEPNYEEKELNDTVTDIVETQDAVVESLDYNETLANDTEKSEMDEVIIEDSLAPKVTADYSVETVDTEEPVMLMGASLEQFDPEETAIIVEASPETSVEAAQPLEQVVEESERVQSRDEQSTEPVYTESRGRSVEPNYEEKELNDTVTDIVEPLDAVVESLDYNKTSANDTEKSEMDEVIIENSLEPVDADEPVMLVGASMEQIEAEETALIVETSPETSPEPAQSLEQTREETDGVLRIVGKPTEQISVEFSVNSFDPQFEDETSMIHDDVNNFNDSSFQSSISSVSNESQEDIEVTVVSLNQKQGFKRFAKIRNKLQAIFSANPGKTKHSASSPLTKKTSDSIVEEKITEQPIQENSQENISLVESTSTNTLINDPEQRMYEVDSVCEQDDLIKNPIVENTNDQHEFEIESTEYFPETADKPVVPLFNEADMCTEETEDPITERKFQHTTENEWEPSKEVIVVTEENELVLTEEYPEDQKKQDVYSEDLKEEIVYLEEQKEEEVSVEDPKNGEEEIVIDDRTPTPIGNKEESRISRFFNRLFSKRDSKVDTEVDSSDNQKDENEVIIESENDNVSENCILTDPDVEVECSVQTADELEPQAVELRQEQERDTVNEKETITVETTYVSPVSDQGNNELCHVSETGIQDQISIQTLQSPNIEPEDTTFVCDSELKISESPEMTMINNPDTGPIGNSATDIQNNSYELEPIRENANESENITVKLEVTCGNAIIEESPENVTEILVAEKNKPVLIEEKPEELKEVELHSEELREEKMYSEDLREEMINSEDLEEEAEYVEGPKNDGEEIVIDDRTPKPIGNKGESRVSRFFNRLFSKRDSKVDTEVDSSDNPKDENEVIIESENDNVSENCILSDPDVEVECSVQTVVELKPQAVELHQEQERDTVNEKETIMVETSYVSPVSDQKNNELCLVSETEIQDQISIQNLQLPKTEPEDTTFVSDSELKISESPEMTMSNNVDTSPIGNSPADIQNNSCDLEPLKENFDKSENIPVELEATCINAIIDESPEQLTVVQITDKNESILTEKNLEDLKEVEVHSEVLEEDGVYLEDLNGEKVSSENLKEGDECVEAIVIDDRTTTPIGNKGESRVSRFFNRLFSKRDSKVDTEVDSSDNQKDENEVIIESENDNVSENCILSDPDVEVECNVQTADELKPQAIELRQEQERDTDDEKERITVDYGYVYPVSDQGNNELCLVSETEIEDQISTLNLQSSMPEPDDTAFVCNLELKISESPQMTMSNDPDTSTIRNSCINIQENLPVLEPLAEEAIDSENVPVEIKTTTDIVVVEESIGLLNEQHGVEKNISILTEENLEDLKEEEVYSEELAKGEVYSEDLKEEDKCVETIVIDDGTPKPNGNKDESRISRFFNRLFSKRDSKVDTEVDSSDNQKDENEVIIESENDNVSENCILTDPDVEVECSVQTADELEPQAVELRQEQERDTVNEKETITVETTYVSPVSDQGNNELCHVSETGIQDQISIQTLQSPNIEPEDTTFVCDSELKISESPEMTMSNLEPLAKSANESENIPVENETTTINAMKEESTEESNGLHCDDQFDQNMTESEIEEFFQDCVTSEKVLEKLKTEENFSENQPNCMETSEIIISGIEVIKDQELGIQTLPRDGYSSEDRSVKTESKLPSEDVDLESPEGNLPEESESEVILQEKSKEDSKTKANESRNEKPAKSKKPLFGFVPKLKRAFAFKSDKKDRSSNVTESAKITATDVEPTASTEEQLGVVSDEVRASSETTIVEEEVMQSGFTVSDIVAPIILEVPPEVTDAIPIPSEHANLESEGAGPSSGEVGPSSETTILEEEVLQSGSTASDIVAQTVFEAPQEVTDAVPIPSEPTNIESDTLEQTEVETDGLVTVRNIDSYAIETISETETREEKLSETQEEIPDGDEELEKEEDIFYFEPEPPVENLDIEDVPQFQAVSGHTIPSDDHLEKSDPKEEIGASKKSRRWYEKVKDFFGSKRSDAGSFDEIYNGESTFKRSESYHPKQLDSDVAPASYGSSPHWSDIVDDNVVATLTSDMLEAESTSKKRKGSEKAPSVAELNKSSFSRVNSIDSFATYFTVDNFDEDYFDSNVQLQAAENSSHVDQNSITEGSFPDQKVDNNESEDPSTQAGFSPGDSNLSDQDVHLSCSEPTVTREVNLDRPLEKLSKTAVEETETTIPSNIKKPVMMQSTTSSDSCLPDEVHRDIDSLNGVKNIEPELQADQLDPEMDHAEMMPVSSKTMIYNIDTNIKEPKNLAEYQTIPRHILVEQTPSVMEEIAHVMVRESYENALHQVFAYLDHKTLGITSQVCKQWRKVSYHPSLWQHVTFSNGRMTSEFLERFSSRCSQLKSLRLENIQGRPKIRGESERFYQQETRASLEPGFESVLIKAEGNLQKLTIINCGSVITERCLWLVSCYARVLQHLTYRSSTDPPSAEVLWALANGCRDITHLNLSPDNPRSPRQERFNNKCAHLIAKNYPRLKSISIGGAGIDDVGLLIIAEKCQQLERLELYNFVHKLIPSSVENMCTNGLQHLREIHLVHMAIDAKIIPIFASLCPNLTKIKIQVAIQDYFGDILQPKDKRKYKLIGLKLMSLKSQWKLDKILQLEIKDCK